MARKFSVPPTYSTRPPASHNDYSGQNRQQRRSHVKNHAIYTRTTVWRDWMDIPLNRLGVAIRVMRIANRRGKSVAWARKRLARDYKKLLAYQQGRNAKLQKIYEEMQQGMLQGEEHDHEH